MDPATIRHRMDNVTHNVENVNRFFSNVNVENMRLVRPALDAYLKKASALHEEFGDLLLEHGSKIFGCDESCVSDCLKPEFISFWEIPMCLKDCRCQEGLISIEQIRGEDKDFFGKKQLLIGLHDEDEIDKEEEDCHHRRKDYKKYRIGHKKDFNLRDLMKYSDYDRSAW
jgi:hypothetical protein